MEPREMKRHICRTFAGVRALDAGGDTFLLYDPAGDLPAERQLPFATIVTGDRYDTASQLSRPGFWRLNIGLTRAAYRELFPAAAPGRNVRAAPVPGVDHAAVDIVMPHPVYASQHWVCVVNPGEATLGTIGHLLADAYGFAARKHANPRNRQATS
ncbi:DUF6194 family protein [Micromonospora phytophila]|uniref:DUF6194 family protein n=1 Tax=Micromonospora phytophila TaxID=709888 RepID=UPI00202E7087|nr:DUF6194 family protein [Micromonospora phytophila]MCM0675302.1 DUF6194 family protein [Micromonospora phytophila]